MRVQLKKIVPLAIMFFCILFNYTILRDTKDVLVVTAPGGSAEVSRCSRRLLLLRYSRLHSRFLLPLPLPSPTPASFSHSRFRLQAIPFLKTWVNLPGAIAFTVLYSSMANRLGRQALFYSVLVSAWDSDTAAAAGTYLPRDAAAAGTCCY